MGRRKRAFEVALRSHVWENLRILGYEPSAPAESARGGYNFEKSLQWGPIAAIQFQLFPAKFRVWLCRSDPNEPPPYETVINESLRHPLFYVFGIRNGQSVPYTFEHFRSEAELARQLQNAVAMLREYGIPWLEDPQSRRSGYVQPENRLAFQRALEEHVGHQLEQIGYESSLNEYQNEITFRKPITHGRFCYIQFMHATTPDRDSHIVFTKLRRSLSPDPAEFLSDELAADIGTLLQLMTGRPYDPGQHHGLYDLDGELTELLLSIHDQLKEFGIPWIENPRSIDISKLARLHSKQGAG